MTTPIARARAKLEEIERELRKHPDFQLYLLTNAEHERARMEAILLSIPAFNLWHKLCRSVTGAIERPLALAEGHLQNRFDVAQQSRLASLPA